MSDVGIADPFTLLLPPSGRVESAVGDRVIGGHFRMRAGSAAAVAAILLGVMTVGSVGAEATSSRNARDGVKQPRPALQQASLRSAKPQASKMQVSRQGAFLLPSGYPPNATGVSCVPYARAVSGVEIVGNAHTWWAGAAGVYSRGHRPERGAVLSFKATGGMRLGHVAAVSQVVSAREILIDHANWEGPGIRKGTIMRGVSVIDVSDRNDWTAVRVQVGRGGEAYGRVYPTNGFIYNRPSEVIMTNASGREELAEAPASAHAGHLEGAVQDLNLDATAR